MAKFRLGDKVRLLAKLPVGVFKGGWQPDMQQYIGLEGTIHIIPPNLPYLKIVGCDWWWDKDRVELVERKFYLDDRLGDLTGGAPKWKIISILPNGRVWLKDLVAGHEWHGPLGGEGYNPNNFRLFLDDSPEGASPPPNPAPVKKKPRLEINSRE